MEPEVKAWVAKCLKEDRASYGRDTGFAYHGETLGITHIGIAAYSTLNDHARQRAFYEYLQQALERAFPDSTMEECYRFPGASWETLELTLDTTNEEACELAYHLITTFEGNELVFRELEEKYEAEETLATIRAYKPKNMKNKHPEDWDVLVDLWLSRNGKEPTAETVHEAVEALGYLAACFCKDKHFALYSDAKHHWSELVTIDCSAAAYDRYEQWRQQQNGALLTRVLPGFMGTHIPYPGAWNDEFDEPVVDQIDGRYICPKCGKPMEVTG